MYLIYALVGYILGGVTVSLVWGYFKTRPCPYSDVIEEKLKKQNLSSNIVGKKLKKLIVPETETEQDDIHPPVPPIRP